MANTYNTKNYFAHGGNELVIGGKLTFLEGAEVENFSEATTVAALKSDFNSLLAVLRTAGILSATAPETAEPPAGGEGGGS